MPVHPPAEDGEDARKRGEAPAPLRQRWVNLQPPQSWSEMLGL